MKKLYRKIHQALHSKQDVIKIDDKSYQIKTTRGTRYIRLDDQVFAQQTITKKSAPSHKVQKTSITRIIRAGKIWGWISNTEIADPLLKEDYD